MDFSTKCLPPNFTPGWITDENGNIDETSIRDYWERELGDYISWEAVSYTHLDVYKRQEEYHEAGRYIREDLKLFPNELGKEHFNNFKYSNKQIEYISVPVSYTHLDVYKRQEYGYPHGLLSIRHNAPHCFYLLLIGYIA